MTIDSEIREQPRVVGDLVDRAAEFGRLGAALRARDIDTVLIAARGTSDHAAIYAQYLFGVRLGLPVGLSTPSVLSLYGSELRLARTLVIGISQSGASPDIVGVVASARRQGMPTVALTNVPGSPLAAAAEHVVDLGAGPELAVAATKTYTAELAAVALLAAALERPADPLGADPDLALLPGAMEAALSTEPAVAEIAAELAARDACVVVGRGYGYATAREWALKLKELAHVVADPYSAADFRHGPVALVEAGFPVLAVAPTGRAADDMLALLVGLRELGAEIVLLSDSVELRELGRWAVPLPTLPEHLAPVASIVPGQLYARHLTLARGLDPDAPRGISKVTRTT